MGLIALLHIFLNMSGFSNAIILKHKMEEIYIFDSDLVWRMQLMIIKG